MNTIWVCLACGKVSKDRFGKEKISRGWDESCFLNSAKVEEDHLVWNDTKDRVIEIKDGGYVENEDFPNQGESELDKLEENLKDIFEDNSKKEAA